MCCHSTGCKKGSVLETTPEIVGLKNRHAQSALGAKTICHGQLEPACQGALGVQRRWVSVCSTFMRHVAICLDCIQDPFSARLSPPACFLHFRIMLSTIWIRSLVRNRRRTSTSDCSYVCLSVSRSVSLSVTGKEPTSPSAFDCLIA